VKFFWRLLFIILGSHLRRDTQTRHDHILMTFEVGSRKNKRNTLASASPMLENVAKKFVICRDWSVSYDSDHSRRPITSLVNEPLLFDCRQSFDTDQSHRLLTNRFGLTAGSRNHGLINVPFFVDCGPQLPAVH
jgi:hypothetical protein